MKLLTSEAAAKLQVILSKRAGRKLTQEELEQAYDALMGFAEALIELDEPKDDPESWLDFRSWHVRMPSPCPRAHERRLDRHGHGQTADRLALDLRNLLPSARRHRLGRLR